MGYPSHEELVVRRIEFAVERGKLTFCAFLHRMNYQARASARAFSFDRKNLSNKNRSAMDAADAITVLGALECLAQSEQKNAHIAYDGHCVDFYHLIPHSAFVIIYFHGGLL